MAREIISFWIARVDDVMAVLHTRESSFAQARRRNLLLAGVFCGLCLLIWLWWVNNIRSGHLLQTDVAVPVLLAFGAAGFVGKRFWHAYRKSASGDKGVERTIDVLRQLPDSYHVLSNVQVPGAYCGLVVVGRNGVFIINTKHHNGTITPSNGDWVQEKTGRRGTDYSSSMRNPVKHMKRQIHVLADYLKSVGTRVWVDGIVFFTNPDVILNGCSDRFTDRGDAVRSYILNYRARFLLSDADVLRLVQRLEHTRGS